MRAKMTAMALFLTLLDRFKNHLFHERKRMKKLALFLTDVKKFNFFTFGVTMSSFTKIHFIASFLVIIEFGDGIESKFQC
jgi:hypothetical protein